MIFERKGNKLIIRGQGEIIWLEPFGEDSLRVRATRGKEIVEEDWTLLPQPEVSADIVIDLDKAVITNGRLSAEVGSTGEIRFVDVVGRKTLLEEYERFNLESKEL